MSADNKKSQKTLEARGLATFAMTYPEEMGIIAVAKDLSERCGEQVSPDQVASLRNRMKNGAAYRQALLQVEKADIRSKLKTLAKDLSDIFDQSSGESDFMRARAYAGHTLAGVYKQLYEHTENEIERVKAEDLGEEGKEEDADFTLVEEPQPSLPAGAPTPAPAEEHADAPAAAPGMHAYGDPAPVDDEAQKMRLLETIL
jgi:hypothetical protein